VTGNACNIQRIYAATVVLHILWVAGGVQTATFSDVRLDPLPATEEDVSIRLSWIVTYSAGW
jgi:hypothetical protein